MRAPTDSSCALRHSDTPAPSPQAVPPGPTSRRWVLDLLLLGALWGASFLFMRMGAAEFGAVPTAAMRVSIASLVLLPWLLWRGQAPDLRQHWRAVSAIGLLNSGLPFVLFAYALIHISTGLSAVLNATVPMFGALVAWAWLGERPDRWRLSGLVIGFAGVALLAGRSAGISEQAASTPALPTVLGILASLGACLSYGLGANAARKYQANTPPMVMAAGSQLGASAVLLLPALWFWPAQNPSLRAWVAVTLLGVACTGLAYVLFFRLIAQAGAPRALTVTFLVPVFAVAYGAIFLGERITTWMLMCAAIIVCGVALAIGLVKPRSRG